MELPEQSDAVSLGAHTLNAETLSRPLLNCRSVPPDGAQQLHMPSQSRAAGRQRVFGHAAVAAQLGAVQSRGRQAAGAGRRCLSAVLSSSARDLMPCSSTGCRYLPSKLTFPPQRNLPSAPVQVSFTATAIDGSTCDGTAVICSVWGVGRTCSRLACTPFRDTDAIRSALTCA